MSKFQSTVSTIAALTTIFSVAVAGSKVADMQRENESQQETIKTLQTKLEGNKTDAQPEGFTPPALPLPPPKVQTVQAPTVPMLPTNQVQPPADLPPPAGTNSQGGVAQ